MAAFIQRFCLLKQHGFRYLVQGKGTNLTAIKKDKYLFIYSARNFYNILKVTPRNAKKLKEADGIPKEYDLIYKNNLDTYMRNGYPPLLAVVTLVPAYILFYYYTQGNPFSHNKYPLKFEKVRVIRPDIEFWVYFAAIFVFTAGVFSILFRTPMRIYRHNLEMSYIAIYVSHIPFKIHQHHYKSATQTKFKNPIWFFFNDCQYLLDNKKAILFDHSFRTPAELWDMLGLD